MIRLLTIRQQIELLGREIKDPATDRVQDILTLMADELERLESRIDDVQYRHPSGNCQ